MFSVALGPLYVVAPLPLCLQDAYWTSHEYSPKRRRISAPDGLATHLPWARRGPAGGTVPPSISAPAQQSNSPSHGAARSAGILAPPLCAPAPQSPSAARGAHSCTASGLTPTGGRQMQSSPPGDATSSDYEAALPPQRFAGPTGVPHAPDNRGIGQRV